MAENGCSRVMSVLTYHPHASGLHHPREYSPSRHNEGMTAGLPRMGVLACRPHIHMCSDVRRPDHNLYILTERDQVACQAFQ